MPDKFIAQAKILRVFNLLNLLASGKYPVKALAEKLNTHQRTVYRYMSLLQEVGFCIDQDFKGRYFLCTTTYPKFLSPTLKAIS